ncbi:MAG: UDP-N-acetylmuramate dehydrogenase [Bacilli bacterium]
MEEVINFIKKKSIGNYSLNVKLSTLTSYKVGSEASVIVYPKNVLKLVALLNKLKQDNIKHKVIGRGSNLIFSDKRYEGVIIKLDHFNNINIKDTVVKVGSGVSLIKLAYKVAKENLTGLEFASGIPGTIGGAVFMNAGAYKSDMGYIVSEVKVLTPDLEIKTLYNKDLNYKYRSSFLKDNPNYVCIEATLVLKKGKKDAIMDLIETRRQKRLLNQPLEYPSAGSVFRNPVDDFAGKLIEDCNLKNYKIGGAMVSAKHANFIINTGKATANDIKSLIDYVHDKVKEKTSVDLKIEQEFVNWE